MNIILKEIGERLRTSRKAKGLTQAQVADMLDMSCNFYGEIERGNCRLSIEKLLLVHQRLEIDLTYLITGETAPSINFHDIISDCPKDKVFDMEQIVRYASHLYRKDN